MKPEIALLLKIIEIALEKGVPAMLRVFAEWTSSDWADGDITQEDIENLLGKLKDPNSYFDE